MIIKKYSLGQLQANCYLLLKEDKCMIIDPADEASFILEKLFNLNLKLVGLIATHGHFDHIMAAGEIQLSHEVPLYIDEKDLFLVKRLRETARYFLKYDPQIVEPRKIKKIPKGNLIIKPFNLRVIKTPGHTPGSSCFYLPDDSVIFTGDTLFENAVGRYDFSYSSFSDLQNSLKEIFKLPTDTIVYPGHGGKTTIDKENKMF